MIKIKTLYKLEKQGKGVKAINEITDGSEWVIKGEGKPYLKLDGTACAIIDGKFYKRLQVKNSEIANKLIKDKGYILCDRDHGDKYYGWIPVDFDSAEGKYHKIGWNNLIKDIAGITVHDWNCKILDSTYELVGENVQCNLYKLDSTYLINHKTKCLQVNTIVPTDFEGLKGFLNDFENCDFNGCMPEGIVWHHEDGRMVKIRRTDFY